MADDVAVVVAPAGTPAPAAPVVAPVVAPVAAPATPVAPTPLPVAVTPPVVAPVIPDTAAEPDVIVYDPTGDPGLDVALGFFGNLGLNTDHPAMAAAINGDFGLLKATLATMGDKAKGWEQMVALGQDAYTRNAEKTTTAKAAATAAIHGIAGGEAQWNTMQAWAAANADPAEKLELNKLFDSGVMGARAAARLIADAYHAASGTVVTPASALRGGASSVPVASNGPLNASEYGAAVRELNAKLGNRMDASPEYAALKARLRR